MQRAWSSTQHVVLDVTVIIQNRSLVPIKGVILVGITTVTALAQAPLVHPPMWSQELESLPRWVIQRKQALLGRQEATLKEDRPNKQGVVAREDSTSLSLIAALSSPPTASWENGYFWKCIPSL